MVLEPEKPGCILILLWLLSASVSQTVKWGHLLNLETVVALT